MFVFFYSCNYPRREVYQFLNFVKLNFSRSTPDTETVVDVCKNTGLNKEFKGVTREIVTESIERNEDVVTLFDHL